LTGLLLSSRRIARVVLIASKTSIATAFYTSRPLRSAGTTPALDTRAGARFRSVDEPADRRPLVGRSGELAALDAVVPRTRRGDWTSAVVVGEPGIGKSALVEAMTL